MGLSESAFGLALIERGRAGTASALVACGVVALLLSVRAAWGSGSFLAWVVWRFHWTCECQFQAHQQARLSLRGEERGGFSERKEGAGRFSLICCSSAITRRASAEKFFRSLQLRSQPRQLLGIIIIIYFCKDDH